MAKKDKKKKKKKQPANPQPGGGGGGGAKNKGIRYGVLKGTVVSGARESDPHTPHYQITVRANRNGAPSTWRCPVNVRSADDSEVMFFLDDNLLAQSPDKSDLAKLWKKKLATLDGLADGFTALPDHEAGAALDYVREEYVTPNEMTHLPSDGPGANDDVQDVVEMLVGRAKDQGATIHVFGAMFEDANEAGVHDIHMNQGNDGKWKADNGVYQDGGLVMVFPSGRHAAMFFAFQTQSWNTDRNGNPK
jgi:uncharacterized protein YukJ